MSKKSTETHRHPHIFVEMWKSDKNGDWYWHAAHYRNHKIMSDSAEGYRERRSCLHGIRTIFPDGVEIRELKKGRDGEEETFIVQ